MSELLRDSEGWPIWPAHHPSFFESIREVWDSGDWGKYQSNIHARCVVDVSRLMTPRLSAELASESPWDGFRDRLNRQPDVRLCSSGTAGIELALRAAGITAGDEVVVAAYDYPGNFRNIELLGATPVLADVSDGGVTMDPQSLRQIQGDSIRAVIVSHLYGQLADMLAIRQICDERNWILIEDACQVPGAGWRVALADPQAEQDGFVPVGGLADASVLSFGGSKLLSAGNGGAVILRNDRMAARLRGYVDRPSDAYAFSALQCAVLIPQLAMLEQFNRQRAEMADRLRRWDWSSIAATAVDFVDGSIRQGSLTGSTTAGGERIRAYYKFAILAGSAPQRSDLLSRFGQIALPVGEGFRSMHATSGRRSRKPVPLDNAAQLGARCLVIDHRALLATDLIERLGAAALQRM